MSSTQRFILVVGLIAALVLTFGGLRTIKAQIVSSDKLRFRLVGDEPIASPDGRSIVSGWKVVVLKDTLSGQCHIAFLAGSAMSISGPGVCP